MSIDLDKIKIMRLRHPVNEQILTGEVPQVTTSIHMQQRVNAIKYRTPGKSFNLRRSQADIHQSITDKSLNKQNRTTLQP